MQDEVRVTDQCEQEAAMHHRQITLADGRYLIFYTFDDDGQAHAAGQLEQGEDV